MNFPCYVECRNVDSWNYVEFSETAGR